METAVLLVPFGICIGFCIVQLWRALNWVWLRPRRVERCLRDQGLKGNPYNLLFGDLKTLSMMQKEAKSKPINFNDDIATRVVPFHHHTVKNYGKNSFAWFGPTLTVNIMNPEEIKDLLNKMDDFPKPTNSPLVRLLLTGLTAQQGDQWRKHRKIINPAFQLEKLKNVLPAIYHCCEQMINQWRTLVSEKGSCELDVWPFFESLTGDIISWTAFGSSYEECRKVFQLQKEQADLTGIAIRSVYVPGWRFVPTKMNKRLTEIDKEMKVLLRGVIREREKAMEAGEAPNDDLLGLLLESNYREIREHENYTNVGLSTEDVINECKIFYFAGQETTSALINWTTVLLSKFPYWQTQAREEVMQIFGSKKPDHDGLNRLKVITMILNEALRLYPPAPILRRAIEKETKLGNLTLPAGTNATVPTILIHRDEELWGTDAKEFKPERFSEGVLKATKGQVSFIPFGWGPRICVAQNFALLEAKMALSLILQNFCFELSPSYAHAPTIVLTLQPQFGTHIILHKL